jgi:hypothetical protein
MVNNMTKMTKREILTAIMNGTVDEAVKNEFCTKEIALLDAKAEKAKARAAAKRAEGDELTEIVASVLTEDFAPIADIAGMIEGEDVTPAKVSYRLNALVKAGRAEKAELTIPASEGGKARKVQGFRALA